MAKRIGDIIILLRSIGSIVINQRSIGNITFTDVIGQSDETFNRISEDGLDTRITEDGNTRITE